MQTFKKQKYKTKQDLLQILADRVITRENEQEEKLFDAKGNVAQTDWVYDENIYSNIEYIEKCTEETRLVKQQLATTEERVTLNEETILSILLGGM